MRKKTKKKRKIIIIFLMLLLITSGVYYTYINFYKPWRNSINTNADANIIDSENDHLYADNDNNENLELDTEAAKSGSTLPATTQTVKTMQLPVEYISQLPELPTGCEITSLATVLNYLGYSVDKEYLAEYYLNKIDDLSGSFNNNFIGSPWDENGWGCFAPAIVNSANKYLSDIGSNKKAYNISGSSIKQLFAEVQNGNPVIVWITTALDEKTTFTDIEMDNGHIFRWPSNEHCVVLIGYDLNSPQTVTLSDPMVGIVDRPYSKFNSRYNELSKRAVVIR